MGVGSSLEQHACNVPQLLYFVAPASSTPSPNRHCSPTLTYFQPFQFYCRLAEELGRGAYGKVFRGIDTRTGDNVAIKQLSLSRLGAEQLTGISNEVELLKALNHRNVVKYLGSFRTKTHLVSCLFVFVCFVSGWVEIQKN